jgi:hypothetical protein
MLFETAIFLESIDAPLDHNPQFASRGGTQIPA